MHTPGPWSADYGDFAVFCNTGAEIAAITPGNHDDGTAVTVPEMEANLNLVVAAPDLLAVCKLLLGSMGEVIEDHNEVAYSDLRLAIMRAEGET